MSDSHNHDYTSKMRVLLPRSLLTLQTSTATVTLPARPVAVNDVYGRDFGGGATVIPAPGVLKNDVTTCGAAATVKLLTQPAVPTVVLNADGGFTYTNSTPVSGNVTFTYQLECPGGLVSEATW